MDLMKEFEEYLPRWSEEKMLPIPTIKHPDRWSVAWNDFIKDVVTPRREEIVAEYKTMKFKTVGMAEKEKRAKEKETEKENLSTENDNATTINKSEQIEQKEETKQKPLTEWERVQAIMRGDL